MTVLPVRALASGELTRMARYYATTPSCWPLAPRLDPVNRWYARIAVDDGHEAWLLTWLPGQGTDLHDHGGSAGAFVVVGGELTEEVVPPGQRARPRTRLAAAGQITRFGARHVHRLTNLAPEPALSVHVYAPRLSTMTRYALDGDDLRVVAVDREGDSW